MWSASSSGPPAREVLAAHGLGGHRHMRSRHLVHSSKGAAHIPGRLGRPLTRRPAREPGGAFASVRDSCHPFTGMARPARLEVGMAATSAVPTDAWEGRSSQRKGGGSPAPISTAPQRVQQKAPVVAGAKGSERILCDAELSEPGQGITRITRQFLSVQPIMGSHPIGKAPGTPVFGVKMGCFVNTR